MLTFRPAVMPPFAIVKPTDESSWSAPLVISTTSSVTLSAIIPPLGPGGRMPDCGPAQHGDLASASGCLARDPADEEKPMQALSEVLREVKLNGAAFLDAQFREP